MTDKCSEYIVDGLEVKDTDYWSKEDVLKNTKDCGWMWIVRECLLKDTQSIPHWELDFAQSLEFNSNPLPILARDVLIRAGINLDDTEQFRPVNVLMAIRDDDKLGFYLDCQDTEQEDWISTCDCIAKLLSDGMDLTLKRRVEQRFYYCWLYYEPKDMKAFRLRFCKGDLRT